MEGSEKRRFNRLSANFSVTCRGIDTHKKKICHGYTCNVCPGGMLLCTPTQEFTTGEFVQAELLINPAHGVLEFGGKISGFARILRQEQKLLYSQSKNSPSLEYGIALEFCEILRLRI